MTTFHLTVATPDGCAFDGQAERVVCRAIDGDIAILARHGDYCTALGMGEAHIILPDGQRRRAACMGGMLSVLDGEVRLVATTWEWVEQIDQARAEASKKRAEAILAQKNLSQREYELICFLASQPGKVFPREVLMERVWNYDGFVGDVRAVDVAIRRLREKVEDDPAAPTFIITRRGLGYCFSGQ